VSRRGRKNLIDPVNPVKKKKIKIEAIQYSGATPRRRIKEGDIGK
jgi:hypothetical protein